VAPPARARAQDRLEGRLIQEQPPARAQRVDAFVQVWDDVRKLPACQCIHGDDRAFRHKFLRRLASHRVLDAELAEHLQSAHVKERRAR